MKSIKLKHKDKKTGQIIENDYYPVNERVLEFRKQYPKGTIDTSIISITDDSVLIRAEIFDGMPDRIHLASGHAFEMKSWSFINTQSLVENCETSAVGRALAFLGIGIINAIASADEMKGVEDTHDASYAQISMIEQLLPSANIDERLRKGIEVEYISFSQHRAQKCITFLKENNANDSLDNQLDSKLKDEKQ